MVTHDAGWDNVVPSPDKPKPRKPLIPEGKGWLALAFVWLSIIVLFALTCMGFSVAKLLGHEPEPMNHLFEMVAVLGFFCWIVTAVCAAMLTVFSAFYVWEKFFDK